jgi:hypothetical protein
MRHSTWWPVLLLLLGCTALAMAEEKRPPVDGKWTWSYKTRDGKDVEVYVKLKQEGDDKLTGAYAARDGKETPITHGKIKGDELSFDVDREVGDQKMLFKYTGKLSGDTISGKIVFGREKPLPHDWEAKRAKE